MEEKNKNYSIIWKLLFILLLGVIGGIIFQAKFISGMDWFLDKSSTCSMFNKTGIDCEVFWCNSVRDGSYNLSTEVCQFTINNTINNTIYVNQTINVTSNTTNISSVNFTEIEQKYYNKSEIDKFFNDSTNSVIENYVSKKDASLYGLTQTAPKSSSSDSFTNTELILILFGIGVVALLIFKLKGNNPYQTQNPLTRGEAPIEYRKLQSAKPTKELGMEYKLEEISEKLSQMEKEKIERDKQEALEKEEKDKKWEANHKKNFEKEAKYSSKIKKIVIDDDEEPDDEEIQEGEE